MEIEYNLFASFAALMPEHARGGSCILSLDDGVTVCGLIQKLRLPEKDAKMVFINGRRAAESAVLKQGDRVGIFPLVAGG